MLSFGATSIEPTNPTIMPNFDALLKVPVDPTALAELSSFGPANRTSPASYDAISRLQKKAGAGFRARPISLAQNPRQETATLSSRSRIMAFPP